MCVCVCVCVIIVIAMVISFRHFEPYGTYDCALTTSHLPIILDG
jgi:hypothetical protein